MIAFLIGSLITFTLLTEAQNGFEKCKAKKFKGESCKVAKKVNELSKKKD